MIGVYADYNTYSSMNLTMNDNEVSISAYSVYGNDIYNVDVGVDARQLTDGSSVARNTLEVYADDEGGNIRFDGVHLSGTEASATLWGNDISVGNMTVQNVDDSHIEISAQYLTLSAGTDLTIDLIDLSSQGVAGWSTPSKDNWWQSDATIDSDYDLTINQFKLDGAQAFLTFDVSAGSSIRYDITLDDLGIGQNNGVLDYHLNGTLHAGLAMSEFDNDWMTHNATEQFDLIDLSDLGITSADQLDYSITMGDRFENGVVESIHFWLKSTEVDSTGPNTTHLALGSTVEFELKDVQLLGSARHDYFAQNGELGAPGQVDQTDVWYAFWNYSLHLNAAQI